MPTLNWIGKEAVVNHHLQVPFHLLKDVPELACGEPGSGNLIVQGDNLVALKALLPYYAGQVKCIYIDPPYNTGNEGWVYNDNVNSPLIREWLGKTVGKEGETLDRHDRWLCMMYPRLALLRQFLREDGAIFISIDDNEVQALRYVMDEIFGSQNFITTVCWQKIYTVKNTARHFSEMHDYLIVYAKHADIWKPNLVPRSSKQDNAYKNPDNDPRGPWKATPLHARNYYSQGLYSITGPTGRIIHGPPNGTYWRYPEASFLKLDASGAIWWGKDGNGIPSQKRFLSEVKQGVVPATMWFHDEAGHNAEAKNELRDALCSDAEMFITPKPTRLIERILELASDPDSLILDSFAGSGTTGHAVLKLNAQITANDLMELNAGEQFDLELSPENPEIAPPQRRFILVEMETSIAHAVTAERVRRVSEGYTNAKGEQVKGLGGGFRYCELDEPLFDEEGKIRETVGFADLARHVWFTETGEPLPVGEAGQANPSQPPLDRGGAETNELLYEQVAATCLPPVKGGSRGVAVSLSPLLGVHNGVGIYLLYNGILGDKSAAGGNVLTRAVLAQLPDFDGPKVIYCAGCLLGRDRLQAERIIVRQTPYEVRVS